MPLQGTICWLAMCRMHQAIRRQLGSTYAKAFIVVTAMQFHLPFYMSRTLPNTFALAVLGFAIADWIETKHPRRLIALLAFTTVRCCPMPVMHNAAIIILSYSCSGLHSLCASLLPGTLVDCTVIM